MLGHPIETTGSDLSWLFRSTRVRTNSWKRCNERLVAYWSHHQRLASHRRWPAPQPKHKTCWSGLLCLRQGENQIPCTISSLLHGAQTVQQSMELTGDAGSTARDEDGGEEVSGLVVDMRKEDEDACFDEDASTCLSHSVGKGVRGVLTWSSVPGSHTNYVRDGTPMLRFGGVGTLTSSRPNIPDFWPVPVAATPSRKPNSWHGYRQMPCSERREK